MQTLDLVISGGDILGLELVYNPNNTGLLIAILERVTARWDATTDIVFVARLNHQRCQ